jgi:hypothetical protein
MRMFINNELCRKHTVYAKEMAKIGLKITSIIPRF